MEIVKKGFFAALLIFMVIAPMPVFSQETEQPGGQLVEQQQTPAPEQKAVDETLRRALASSETDRADLEKKYRDLSEKERQIREQFDKLTAEKEALLKECPPKTAAREEDAKTTSQSKKKKGVGRHPRPVVKKKGTQEYSGAGGEGKTSKKRKLVANAKQRSSAGKVAVAPSASRSCGAKTSMVEVKRALQKGRNLSGKNLNGLKLAGMDLSSVNLSGACMVKTDLDRANLQEANLERADLAGANLRKASLLLANVNDVSLNGAVLDDAIWSDGRTCLSGSIGKCRDVIP